MHAYIIHCLFGAMLAAPVFGALGYLVGRIHERVHAATASERLLRGES